ncbi:MAG: hypothetical protein ABIS03_05065 [Gemmatimonadaceae bacterium]
MKSRPGFALAAALLALVLIAALVSGAMFSALQETRTSRAEIVEQQATSLAERVAIEAIADWRCDDCDGMAIGSVISRNQAPIAPFASRLFVTRLDSALYLVTGEVRDSLSGVGDLRRRVSIAVRTARDADSALRAGRIAGDAWVTAYQPE